MVGTEGGLRRRSKDQHGFSMVELMIVVTILGVLVALALPTFLGARDRANDAAAKASIRTGLTTGRVIFSTEQDYSFATLALLTATDDSVLWVSAATTSAAPTTVSRDIAGGVLTLAAFSRAGTCFFLRDDPPSNTQYGRLDAITPTDCYAGNAGAVTFGPAW